MNKLFLNLIFIGSLMILISSCRQEIKEDPKAKNKAEIPLTQQQIDSLNFVYTALNDSLDANWTVMIQDDDEKIEDMKKLLSEVSKTARYDKGQHETLVKELNLLPEIRYDRETMADSDKIDEYDSANSTVTKEVILFAANLLQYNNSPELEDIINDIQAADNRVILHRIRYDRSAKDLNAFVKQNDQYFRQTNSYAQGPKEAALFELSN